MENFKFLPKNNSVLAHFSNITFSQFSHLHIQLNQSQLHFPKQEEIYEHLIPFKASIVSFFDSLDAYQQFLLAFVVFWAFTSLISKRPKASNAVYHGYRSWLEPTFLVQARYIVNARNIISSGYQKVCYV